MLNHQDNHPTKRQSIAYFGAVEMTDHLYAYLDDEDESPVLFGGTLPDLEENCFWILHEGEVIGIFTSEITNHVNVTPKGNIHYFSFENYYWPGHSYSSAWCHAYHLETRPDRLIDKTEEVLLLAEEDGFSRDVFTKILNTRSGLELVYCVNSNLRIYRILTDPESPGLLCYVCGDEWSYKTIVNEIKKEIAVFGEIDEERETPPISACEIILDKLRN